METVREVKELVIAYKSFRVKTAGLFYFCDITVNIEEFIWETGIKDGQVVVQVTNTTASVFINENESGLLKKDFLSALERFAPKSIDYEHDDFAIRTQNMTPGECANGHSHCKALILPFSVSIILRDGKLRLGKWARVMLVELDRARDDREVEISVIGSK